MNVMTAFTAESTYGTYGRHDRIRVRRGIIGCGAGFTVALDEAGKVRYVGENRWGQKDADLWKDMLAVYCGPDFVLGIRRDGGVRSAGRSKAHGINVKSWACVSSIACGQRHAAALISNGQILTSGDNRYGQCETTAWRDMMDVCCGRQFTVGLKHDGTLLAAGGGKRLHHIIERWPRVAGIFTDQEGKQLMAITYGEGRLLSTDRLPACTKRWRNLVFVAASARGVVGVTAQGRLLSSHREDARKLERMEKDYTVCAMGPGHLAVVCRSGEVISTGHNEYSQCSTARWGCLFERFEDFSNRRREEEKQKEIIERLYQKRLTEATRHSRRLVCGERLTACIQADGHVSATAGLKNVKNWRNVCYLSSGSAHILALHKDGTVSAEGNNVGGCCRVKDWKRVKAIRTGKYHSLGLCEDGTVMFAGWNIHGQGNVTDWKDIRLLRSTDTYTVGVDHTGKMFFSGKKLPFDPEKLDMNEWKDLSDLALSEHHMVGLRKDGSVVAVGDNTIPDRDENGRLVKLCKWQGVRGIAVGDGFTAGLCYGGHVLTAGRNDWGQCETESWINVVSVGCGRNFTAALTADGRVLTAGQHMSSHGQNLSVDEIGEAVMVWEKSESTGYEPFHTEWMKDILAIKCGREHLVAVDIYGQVMAEGLDLDGQCTSAATFALFKGQEQLDGLGVFTTTADLLPMRGENNNRDMPPKMPRVKAPATLQTSQNQGNQTVDVLYQTYEGLEKLRCLHQKYLQNISCGDEHLAVIKQDGSLVVFDLINRKVCPVSSVEPLPPMKSMSSQRHRTVMVARDGTPWVYSHKTGSVEKLSHLPEHRRNDVKDVVRGKEHTAVLYEDGTVYAFGENDDGRCDTQSFRNIVSVSLGERHTVCMTADGRVLSAGTYNREDKKGIAYAPKHDPCNTQSWIDVKRVICGNEVTYGLKVSGEVIAVGKNTYGQCRTETWHGVVDVVTSGSHTVGLRHNGQVLAVGKNDHGECDVSHWENIIAVGALNGITVGLAADGRVLSAGRRKGELSLTKSVYAMGVFGTRQVFLLSDGSIAICTGDQEWTVSLPDEVSLFDLSPANGVMNRVEASLPWDMTARALLGRVGQGILHTVYLTEKGVVKTTDPLERLTSLEDRKDHLWISAGLYHAVAVTADGHLSPIGAVPQEQALERLDELANKGDPSEIPKKGRWRSVTCGTHHTVAVTSEGRGYAVGQNDFGQCLTQDFVDVSMVACGLRHTVAMTTDGHAVAVGDNTYGQCDVSDWSNLAMVACGEAHTVGLFLDGHVEAVGDNRLGQCRLEKVEGIVSVACLPEATVCVSADGRVTIYGGTGEFRDRVAALTDVVAVYACEYRLSALTGDGRLISVK